MRSMFLFVVVVVFVAGCADGGDSPTDPFESATTVSLSHMDGSGSDLCGGFSPCDAVGYGHGVGVEGMCFLPPTVDNHRSDEACSGDFLSGIDDGVFELLICKATYVELDNGTPDGTDHRSMPGK